MTTSSQEYKLYGSMFSLYTAKTRAYLQYKRLPYVEQMNHIDFGERIVPIIHKFMIPVVEDADGTILQDTTDIIDQLEERHPDRPIWPEDPVLVFLCRFIEFFTDEVATPLAMHYRWNYPESNSYITQEFTNWIGLSVGREAAPEMGKKMAGQMQQYLPRLGVADEEGQALTVHLFESVARALDDHLEGSRFVFGDRPCHADMSLYLCFYAHEYRDFGPAQKFLKNNAHHLSYYLDTLHAGAGCSSEGHLEPTGSLIEFLKSIGPITGDYALEALRIGDRLVPDLKEGEPADRKGDVVTVTIDGKPFTRGCSLYSSWKAVRVLDAYNALLDEDRARADQILEQIGAVNLVKAKPSWKLIKSDYQIVKG